MFVDRVQTNPDAGQLQRPQRDRCKAGLSCRSTVEEPGAVDAAPATAGHRTAPQRSQAAMESQLHPRRVTAQKYPGRAAGAALCSGAEQCAGLDG